MQKLLCLLALLCDCGLAASLLHANASQADTEIGQGKIRVIGARSCNAWAKDRDDELSWPAIANRNWLMGFLSGVAIGANRDMLKDADILSLVAWMDDYCANHPLKYADEGAVTLARKLLSREYVSPPKSTDNANAY